MTLHALGWMAWGLVFFVGATPAHAVEDYPVRMQAGLRARVVRDTEARLRKALETYNKTPQSAGVVTRTYPAGSPLKAEWKNSRIEISEAGNTVSIGVEDLLMRSMQINGERFQWNLLESESSNLSRYEKRFVKPEKAHVHLPLIREAFAGETAYSLRAAGLRLYFIATATGEVGEELYRINANVKEMRRLCELPEAPPGKEDPFTTAFTKASVLPSGVGDAIVFNNCDSVKNYARSPVATVSGSPVYPRVPKDLCYNLDALAECMRKQMDPASVSTSRTKKPGDKEEWYEPTPLPSPTTAPQGTGQAR